MAEGAGGGRSPQAWVNCACPEWTDRVHCIDLRYHGHAPGPNSAKPTELRDECECACHEDRSDEETLSEYLARAGVEELPRYRWCLGRNLGGDGWFGDPAKTLLWVMLNPSTADERRDDPTIRKCTGFTKRWGFSALRVVNLFALRATKPADLWRLAASHDIVGRENDATVRAEAASSAAICVAWGAVPAKAAQLKRIESTLELLGARELLCVGRTAAGDPRHPLMAPYTGKPEIWRAARGG